MTPNRFEGKVAIVTGGSMGIGRATALQLAREGAQVVACARRMPRLESLAEEIAAFGGRFKGVELDIGNIEAFAKLIEDTAAEYGRLDVLVNNAPTVIGGMIADQNIEDWRANFGVCVESVFIGVQAALKIMQPQGSGSIINISSVSSLRAGMAAGAYSAAKAAVNQFSMCAAMEAAPYGVRVNVVAPGAINTDMLQKAYAAIAEASGSSVEEAAAGENASIPLGRPAEPEEIAAAMAFLCSNDASFMTGAIIPVDGGALAK